MHDSTPRPLLCDRTREWVALGLDAELSEFETALMTAHLERCSACRTFSAEIAAITGQLRAAPLEPPARPIALPSRRVLPLRRPQLVAAAAVIVVAAGLGGVVGSVRSSAPQADAAALVHAPMVGNVTSDPLLRDEKLASLRKITTSLGATKPVLRATA
jgi:hypothetical protein